MTGKIRLTPRAKEDLRKIGRYTQKTWGKAQRNNYLRALDSRFAWLADKPGRGRLRADVAEGYYCFPQGLHLIFYLILDDGIAIIGVPHQLMDIARHLTGDDSGA